VPAVKALAELALLEGRHEMARTRLQMLQEQAAEAPQTELAPWLAWVALQEGEEAEAEALLARATHQATTEQHQLALVETLCVHARLETRQGRWEQAQEDLRRALGLCQTMPYPYAEAKALYVYGLLHAAKGEPDQARARYKAALAICVRLGEGNYRLHIESAIAALEQR
jgi:tetratricopeptide (TPR) repeat protein